MASSRGAGVTNHSADNAGGFVLSHDAFGRLNLVGADGVRHEAVEPVRGFPISDPDRWISICDAEGRELAFVDDLNALPTELRGVLERDLARREFVPLIRRILSVPTDTEPTQWEVETDRGTTRFMLNTSDDVRRLTGSRASDRRAGSSLPGRRRKSTGRRQSTDPGTVFVARSNRGNRSDFESLVGVPAVRCRANAGATIVGNSSSKDKANSALLDKPAVTPDRPNLAGDAATCGLTGSR